MKRVVCSRKCSNEIRKKSSLIIKYCKVCGNKFERSQYQNDQTYCSVSCANRERKNIDKKIEEYNICAYCGSSFVVTPHKKKYCKMACRIADKKANRVEFECKQCKKKFNRPYSENKPYSNFYCSLKCYHIAKPMKRKDKKCIVCGQDISLIADGRESPSYCSEECIKIDIERRSHNS